MLIKELRLKKGFSQWDLAILTGIPQPKYSLIERGYVKPSSIELTKLSTALTAEQSVIAFPRPWVLEDSENV